MSDDFIPFNQSTPIQGGWQRRNQNRNSYQNYHQNGQQRNSGGFNNRWSNSSPRNNSFGGNRSSGNRSQQDVTDINAYLHPSMLQDPWAHLKKKTQEQQST